MHIYGPPHRRPPLDPLTGIRFIAAFAVLLFHSGAGFASEIKLPGFVVTLLENGYLGVSMFFVLSGFILTYNYSNKLEHSRAELTNFAISRFARIYPTYILCLAIMLPVPIGENVTFSDACRVLIMIQAWTLPASPSGYAWIMQAWTLSIEFAFYVAFPFLLLYVSRLNGRALGLALAICVVFIVGYATPTAHPSSTERPFGSEFIPLPLLRMSEFLFGMMLCRVFFVRPKLLLLAGNQFMTFAVIIATLVIMSATKNKYAASCVTILIGLLFLQLAEGRNIITRALSSRIFLLLGGASYALYIAAGPLREWMRLIPNEAIARGCFPAVAILFSVLVFLAWEQPLRRRITLVFRGQFSNSFKNEIRRRAEAL